MIREEHCRLVLAFARVLYVNGQSTEQTVAAAQRLASKLGLRAHVALRWGELQLQLEEDSRPIWQAAANPVGVDMRRVASAMRIMDDVEGGRLTPDAALKAIETISRMPPGPTWLISLAAGGGAVGMAVIFGVEHLADVAMIFVIAATGAFLRRGLGRLSTNALVQPFCASLLTGILAAVAFRHQLILSLRLVALSPCVILIPGSHVLNGLADLLNGRVHLGGARLIHAGLVLAAITTGLLFGLVLCGASLPLDEPSRAVPLWQDVIATGVAVAAFSIMFSVPPNLLLWPIAVGMLAHALRWAALAMDYSVGAATLVASLAIGVVLMPVARRRRIPFAGIGFVSVVSMIPGAYIFTMASGLVQIAGGRHTSLELISATIANGATAMLIILAISLGLIVPKLTLDYLDLRWSR